MSQRPAPPFPILYRRRRPVLLLACLLGLAVLALAPLATSARAAEEFVVDDADASVQVGGGWTSTSMTAGFHGSGYRFRVAGTGSATVRWPAPTLAAGRYEVFARWTAGANRATDVAYTIAHAGGL